MKDTFYLYIGFKINSYLVFLLATAEAEEGGAGHGGAVSGEGAVLRERGVQQQGLRGAYQGGGTSLRQADAGAAGM